MRPLARPALVLLLVIAGCDVIYERPAIDFSTDFGEPYDVLLSEAPGMSPAPPFVTADGRLVVDVAYRSGCSESRFAVEARRRDAQTAEVWLVHHAEAGSCEAGTPAVRRLTFALPAGVVEVSRLVLLLPDRSAVVLARAY